MGSQIKGSQGTEANPRACSGEQSLPVHSVKLAPRLTLGVVSKMTRDHYYMPLNTGVVYYTAEAD